MGRLTKAAHASVIPVSLCGGMLICCLYLSSANAQTPRYRIDSWTTNNGLPQNSVNAILQTRDGYLWLTTADGLVRYDGVSFTVFDRSNSNGITTTRLDSLFEASDGSLWIGTESGDLIVYKNGQFRPLSPEEISEPSEKLQIDGEELVLYQDWKHTLLADGRVMKQRRTPGARLYIGPSGTRWRVDGSGLHEERAGNRFDYPFKLSARYIGSMSLYEDSSGSLWLGVAGTGLCTAKEGKFSKFGSSKGVPSGDIGALIRDRRGVVWFGMRGGLGLACLKDDRVI